MPKTDYGRVRFVAVGNDLIVGFEETKDRGDDEVNRDDNMVGLLGSPLEVMLGPYLNGRRERKGEGDDGFVISKMEQLTGPEALVLKGSKLPIRPPIL